MKTSQAALFAIALLTLFASCQSNSGQLTDLSKNDTRKEIMSKIANDSMMSKEMIDAMMNSNNGMMMMQQSQMAIPGNHSSMMNLLQNNPAIMQSMLSFMVESSKGDTTLMSGMIKTMMANPQMVAMMQRRMRNEGMKGMKHMGAMGN